METAGGRDRPDERYLTDSDPRSLPLVGALIALGRQAGDVSALVQEYNERLVALGLPVDRATAHLSTLHSERIGTGRVWRPGQEVIETDYGFGVRSGALFLGSPVRAAEEAQAPVELWPFVKPEAHSFNILPELRAEAIAHYIAYPLFLSDGTINVASFATKRAGGFDPRDRALLESLMPLYTRMLEIKNLRQTVEELLKIYVGRGPGVRILSGNTERGQVSRLSAAMLLADMRHFTDLSNRIPERRLVQLLNDFYDCFVPPIAEAGGEVLKFIGDAVLAIFPQPDGMARMASPRERALTAARQGLARLADYNSTLTEDPAIVEAGVALHLGRVAYGNVGSVERLDFTAIGPDVNLVARLANLCSRLEQPLLLSERFARGLILPLRDLGAQRLKGFAQRQRVFTLEPGALEPAAGVPQPL
ncbi:MAG: adenylate/guanylate cyclase domain-containing protein [Rhodospirillales bacterium]|nr:adenylate/guanylate cyclase domain-containing protein [Rhodospirillales bacterium]